MKGTLSGKQKKKILQARKKRNENKKHEKEHPSDVVEEEEENSSTAPSTNQRGVKLIREIYGLKTVFAREPDDVVHERRLRAQIEAVTPFARRELWEHEDLSPAFVLGMPCRPQWDKTTTKQQLEEAETSAFCSWIKGVYAEADRRCAEDKTLELNFFEHNLDVWRQLWRSVEMGDVLLICCDVRWPLFTFPRALVDYASNVLKKPIVLTLTKTDLVAPRVARLWEERFFSLFPRVAVAMTNAFPVVDAGEGGQRVKAKKDQRVKVLLLLISLLLLLLLLLFFVVVLNYY
jgi:hypothetical protein